MQLEIEIPSILMPWLHIVLEIILFLASGEMVFVILSHKKLKGWLKIFMLIFSGKKIVFFFLFTGNWFFFFIH